MYRIPPEQRLTPHRSGVIAACLPLHPILLVREDRRTLSSGLRAPVKVIAENWNDMIIQRNLFDYQSPTWGLVIKPEVWRRHDQTLQGVQQVDVLGVGEPLEPKRDKIKELSEDDLSI